MRPQLFYRVDEARTVHRAVRGIFGFVLVLIAVPALFDLQPAHRGGGCFERHHACAKYALATAAKSTAPCWMNQPASNSGLSKSLGPKWEMDLRTSLPPSEPQATSVVNGDWRPKCESVSWWVRHAVFSMPSRCTRRVSSRFSMVALVVSS